MTRIIKFDPSHLDVIELRDYEQKNVIVLKDFRENLAAMAEKGMSGTLICEGRIITCMGFLEIWNGVFEVWQVPSKYVRENMMAFARAQKRYVNSIFRDFKARRVQTTSPDDRLHREWMTWLGFQEEGLLRKYTHTGLDHIVWGRIK